MIEARSILIDLAVPLKMEIKMLVLRANKLTTASSVIVRAITFLVIVVTSTVIATQDTRADEFQIDFMKVCSNGSKPPQICSQVIPPFSNLKRNLFRDGHVYFIARIRFFKEAVQFMQDNGYYQVNVVTLFDGGVRREFGVGISEDNWDNNGSAYLSEFKIDGSFTFTTYFHMPVADHSDINVELTDQNENVARTGSDPVRVDLVFRN